jgi:hypothetical protein
MTPSESSRQIRINSRLYELLSELAPSLGCSNPREVIEFACRSLLTSRESPKVSESPLESPEDSESPLETPSDSESPLESPEDSGSPLESPKTPESTGTPEAQLGTHGEDS